MFPAAEVSAFVQVVFIDLVLAGDNAVIVALAAAGLPEHQRRRVIVAGVALAAVLRIAFALVVVQLLKVPGLLLVGGLLLLWIAWKLADDLRPTASHPTTGPHGEAGRGAKAREDKTVGQAMMQIVIADVSMSLDNVLGVAAVAREHPVILAFGLILSVVCMGFAATLVSRLLQRHRWVAWVGVAIIVWVGALMTYEGALELLAFARA